jgi:hypothetical protein
VSFLGFWKVEKKIAEKFKCHSTALVLADFMGKEAVLKKGKKLMKGGWFYYNVTDIEKNLFIGRSLRRKIVSSLIESKLVQIKKETTTLNRTHYKLDHAAMACICHAVVSSPLEVNDDPASEVNDDPASEVNNDPTYKETSIRNNNKNKNPIVPLDIKDLWNEIISFKKALGLTPKRKKAIETLLKDFPDISKWREVFLIVENSTFLSGKTKKPWKGCNLDWVVNPNNWLKILEGNFSDEENKEKNNDTALKLINKLGENDNANF